MDPHQQNEEGHRGQQTVEQLGQVFCEVGIDLLHALAGQHDHLAGGDGLAVARAEAGELFVNFAAEGTLDIFRGTVAHVGGQHSEAEAQRHRAQADHKAPRQQCTRQAARKNSPQQHRNGADEDHVAEHPKPLKRHIRPHEAQRAPVKGQ